MKKLVGGSVALLIGVFSFSVFLEAFVEIALGIVPIMLILSGLTAIYLKRDQLKFRRKEAETETGISQMPVEKSSEPKPVPTQDVPVREKAPAEKKAEEKPAEEAGPVPAPKEPETEKNTIDSSETPMPDKKDQAVPETPAKDDKPEVETKPPAQKAATADASSPTTEEIEAQTAKEVEPPADERADEAETAETEELVGNTESNVFHRKDCKFSKSKRCTEIFSSSEEAVKAGYKPCGVCKP